MTSSMVKEKPTESPLETGSDPFSLPKRKLIVARAAGYCFGVRRAVEMAQSTRERFEGRVTTLGKLIHNPQEIARLQEKGIEASDRLTTIKGGAIVLSAHGVPPSIPREAREQGLQVVDTTCPFVTKVHRAAIKLFQEGYQILLVGDAGHTEIIGIIGAVEEVGGKVTRISLPEEVESLVLGKKVGIISQTTQTAALYGAIVAEVSKRVREVKAINTICGATDELQSAAVDMAQRCDVAIVVGGKMSANTRRLRDLCEKQGISAYHIETPDEIREDWLFGKETVGITAGASTPDWLIEDTARRLYGGNLPEDWNLTHPDA